MTLKGQEFFFSLIKKDALFSQKVCVLKKMPFFIKNRAKKCPF